MADYGDFLHKDDPKNPDDPRNADRFKPVGYRGGSAGGGPTPSTAYVVTSGSYSDYSIHRVYLDETEATAYVQMMNGGGRFAEYGIEEWPVGESGYYRGNVWHGTYSAPDRWPGQPDARHKPKLYSHPYDGLAVGRAQVQMAEWRAGWTFVDITGTDRDAVEKALHDHMARIKAERAGIT